MSTAQPQPKRGARRIDLEELWRLPSFYAPALSWKGDRVAFYYDKTGRIELYVMDIASREVRQISHGEVPRALKAAFVWSRDDRYIVFGKDQNGDEQDDLYRIDVETGQVDQLTHDPKAIEYPAEFSPDDAWLTVVTNKSLPEAPDQPGQLNLWKVRADGSEQQPVTRSIFPAVGGQWSKSGEWLSYISNDDPANLKNNDVYIIRPDGSDSKKVLSVKPGSQDHVSDWHPDGRQLAVSTDAYGTVQAGVLDLDSGDVRWMTAEGIEEQPAGFSESGRYLLAIRNHEAQTRPVIYDLQIQNIQRQQGRELNLPAGTCGAASFLRDDQHLLLSFSTDTTRPSLILYDLESDSYETLLAPEYGSIDSSIFVEATHITYPSFDGLEIPAILYAPSGIPEGAKLPAMVHVHGGPTWQWSRGFDPFAQSLVDQGLVVLEPNPRGSTGYGVEFREGARFDWGGKDLEDIVHGAEYLKSLPYVDPERIIVFGGSYGGFMTYIAMTKKPDIWRAGIAWVGITDLQRMYDESMEHYKYFLRDQMGDPEQNVALWEDRSAVNFAEQMTGKLLMVHGANDPRCPVSQARVFRDRLLELGRREGDDFEYVELSAEGHGSTDIEQKIRIFRLLSDYLDRVV